MSGSRSPFAPRRRSICLRAIKFIISVTIIVTTLNDLLVGKSPSLKYWALDSPPPWQHLKHPQKVDKRWRSTSAPRKTNAWWVNLVVGTAASVMTPYGVRFRGGLLEVGYGASRRVSSSKSIVDPFVADLAIGLESPAKYRLLISDQLTATFEVGRRRKCIAYLARGSPYATVEFKGEEGEAAVVESPVGIASAITDEDQNTAVCSAHSKCAMLQGNCCPNDAGLYLDCCSSSFETTEGSMFSLILGDGTQWRLYASRRVALYRLDSDKVRVENADTKTPFVGVLRVAVLPTKATDQQAVVASLDAHARAYAVGSNVSWTVVNSTARLSFEWTVRGGPPGSYVAMALPHHVATVVDGDFDDRLSGAYESLKGELQALVGATWTMHEPLPSISLFARRPSRKPSDVALLVEEDVARLKLGENDDAAKARGVYGSGKRASRFASLAIAAMAVGLRNEAIIAALAAADAVAPWLNTSNREGSLLVYDRTYGGVVTREGLADQAADFGNGWYNDHHFHYGYLVYAASVAIKILGVGAFRSEAQFRALAALVADVASPAPSRYFPAARHKDFYDGHSWASGLFEMNDGRSQESVSEAIHCYYAVALFADALGNELLGEWSRLLLALELRAAKTYWHIFANSVYPPPFATANRIVAVLGASDVSASTWFAAGPVFAHLVNALPFTPVTELLLEPAAYVAAAANDVAAALAVYPDDDRAALDPWRALYLQMRAVVEPDAAARDVLVLAVQGDPQLDSTQSLGAMMYWATTRPYPDEIPVSFNTTVEKQGPLLDDDDTAGVTCSAHLKCVYLGLRTGNCCPTDDGTMLWCCDISS